MHITIANPQYLFHDHISFRTSLLLVPQRSQHGLPVAPSLRQASPLPRSGWVLRKDRRKMQHVQTFPFMMSCCNAMCWALCKHCNNFYHVLIMCWVLCTTFTARLRLIYDVMFKLTLFLFVGTRSLPFPKLTDTISLRFELLVLKAIQGQTQMNQTNVLLTDLPGDGMCLRTTTASMRHCTDLSDEILHFVAGRQPWIFKFALLS
jgi:hypothetical protein